MVLNWWIVIYEIERNLESILEAYIGFGAFSEDTAFFFPIYYNSKEENNRLSSNAIVNREISIWTYKFGCYFIGSSCCFRVL